DSAVLWIGFGGGELESRAIEFVGDVGGEAISGPEGMGAEQRGGGGAERAAAGGGAVGWGGHGGGILPVCSCLCAWGPCRRRGVHRERPGPGTEVGYGLLPASS